MRDFRTGHSGRAAAVLPAGAETVKLTLLGVGDVYNFEEEDGRGGFARLNAVAKAERAANPNTLYLFNGDMLSPSLMPRASTRGRTPSTSPTWCPSTWRCRATTNSTSGRRISSRR
jgi:2',3'-cyclic-nucleotide 2'-phosphodiesterase (5'-nucleotidase family)